MMPNIGYIHFIYSILKYFLGLKKIAIRKRQKLNNIWFEASTTNLEGNTGMPNFVTDF